MSDFPSLAEVMKAMPNPIAADEFEPGYWRSCATWDDIVREVEKVWRDACTITTAEQLDALPDRSIVRAGTNGHAYEKSMLFTLTGRRWMEAGNGSPERSDAIGLPALLIWHPGWTA
jgi:hypothetical protein